MPKNGMDGVGLHAHARDDDACADRRAAQDVVDDARHADGLEDHRRVRAVERRPVGRVDGRGGAHRLGQLASPGRKVGGHDGFHAALAKRGDDREADRAAAEHQGGLAALDRRLVHRVQADGHRLGQRGVRGSSPLGIGSSSGADSSIRSP